jgi:hypothetical protein
MDDTGWCKKCDDFKFNCDCEKTGLQDKVAEHDDSCFWDLNDEDSNIWLSGCMNDFIFNEGSPSDNGFKFCPYCGKLIIVG